MTTYVKSIEVYNEPNFHNQAEYPDVSRLYGSMLKGEQNNWVAIWQDRFAVFVAAVVFSKNESGAVYFFIHHSYTLW